MADDTVLIIPQDLFQSLDPTLQQVAKILEAIGKVRIETIENE